LYTKEQFKLLKGHIEKLMSQMYENLKSGKIERYPYRDGGILACEYCEVKDICGIDEEKSRAREKIRLKPQEVKNRLEEANNEQQ